MAIPIVATLKTLAAILLIGGLVAGFTWAPMYATAAVVWLAVGAFDVAGLIPWPYEIAEHKTRWKWVGPLQFAVSLPAFLLASLYFHELEQWVLRSDAELG